MMNKIALCIYMCGKVYQSLDHLGLSSLSAVMVENGYDVKQFHIYEAEEERILEDILEYAPQYLGFTIYAANINNTLRIVERLKQRHSQCKIIFGGPTPTYEPERIIEQEKNVDYVVKGEGELTLPDLVKRIDKGMTIEECNGVCWRDEAGKVVNNPPRDLLDNLDLLPFPLRHQDSSSNIVHFNLETSRGCIASCSFCNSKYSRIQHGKSWRGKTIPYVMDEIEQCIKKYNVNRFNIVDLSFEDPGTKGVERLKQFIAQLKERNLSIKYTAHFRAEFLDEVNRPLLEKLMESGLTKASLGIEAGNNRSLKIYNKIASVEDNKRAIKLLSEYNIPMIHGFINFNPYTHFEDLAQNADFLLNCGWAYRIEDFCSRVEVFPGTPLKERLIKDGLMDQDFSYRNNLTDYRFEVEKVGWFSDLLCGLLKRNRIDIDFGLYTESLVFEIKQNFEKMSVPEKVSRGFKEFINKYHSIILDMGKNHHQFFIKAIELAQEAKTFSELEIQYLALEEKVIGQSVNSAYEKVEELKLRFMFVSKRNGVDFTQLKQNQMAGSL